jgi:hypothetical protein
MASDFYRLDFALCSSLIPIRANARIYRRVTLR